MTYKQLLEYNQQLAKEQNALQAQSIEQQKKAMAEQIALQNQLLTQNAQTKKAQTAASYREIYDENAVNQYVSQRRVAESMANLGLTDSGLNRTQQTAVLLSRGNADNRTRLAEQAAIDSIEHTLSTGLVNNQIKLNDYNAKLDDQLTESSDQRLQDAQKNADKQYQSYIKAQSSSSSASGSEKVGTVTDGTAKYEDIYKQNLKDLTSVMYSQEERGVDQSQLAEFAKKYIVDYNLSATDMKFLIAKFGIEPSDLPDNYYEDIEKQQKRVKKLLIGLDEYEKSRANGSSFNVISVIKQAFGDYNITEYGAAKLIPQLIANGYLTDNDAQYIAKFYNKYLTQKRKGTLKATDSELLKEIQSRYDGGIISRYGAIYMRALLSFYTSPGGEASYLTE